MLDGKETYRERNSDLIFGLWLGEIMREFFTIGANGDIVRKDLTKKEKIDGN